LEQGGNERIGRCSLLTPALPQGEGKKDEKGETLTSRIAKPSLLITLIVLRIREIRKNT